MGHAWSGHGYRWLTHVRTVLSSAWTVAYKAHTQRTPVLVHCSHGWDRTSQVSRAALQGAQELEGLNSTHQTDYDLDHRRHPIF
ncbi:unnamed protein product, partial [Laminaria digitata]